MSFYVPAQSAEEWRRVLPDARRRWREGGAARALAYLWQGVDGFPAPVRRAFRRSRVRSLNLVKPIIGIPGYKVSLPPKGSIVALRNIGGITLCFGWVRGKEE